MSIETKPHRSASQLKTYAGCSEQYRLERIAKVPSPPAAWTVRGTAMHTAFEVFERSNKTSDIVATFCVEYDAGIAEALEECPDIAKWPRPLSWKPETAIAKYREKGIESCLAFREESLSGAWEIFEMPDMTPGVEVPFILDLDGILVRGFIDAILEWPDGTITVRDYKSGVKPPTPIQLGIYALAVRKHLGLAVWWGDYWTGKANSSAGMIDLSRYTTEFVSQQVKSLDQGVRSEVFLPAPGDHCTMCGVKDFCREQGSRFAEAMAPFHLPSRLDQE